MIMGVGIDITERERMKEALDDAGAFARYTFTEAERSEAQDALDSLRYYSGRFCVKEAVIKALGRFVNSIGMTDIETLNDESGAPFVRLDGQLAKLSNITVHVTISHEPRTTIAFVVAETQ